MSMLAFLPWLKIKNNFDIENFKLVRFEVLEEDSSKEKFQNTCEAIIRPYYTNIGDSINECTLIFLNNKDFFEDFTDDEIESLFSFVEILTFSGLSKREFFSNFSYFNSSNFHFVVQGFNKDLEGVTIVTRRRDGQSKNFIDIGSYKVIMPFYVNNSMVKIDINLFKSLLDAQKKLKDKWLDFSDAIFFFNRANTDSDQITKHQEAVMMIGAFQRILMCKKNSKIDELIKNFKNSFTPKKDLDISKSKRILNSKYANKIGTLREAWLNDFYQLRGDYAHGKKETKKQMVWNAREHLLLGSYMFPLLVKLSLNKDQYYDLSEEDFYDIELFEQLAEVDLFKKPQNPNNWEWKKIRREYISNDKLHKAITEAIKELEDKK
ncbi:MAG: hypothetical protein M1479_10040 [Actinobacteria bacterium]|nr:hypothetical protein [Actinomycetota bacterium]